MNNTLTQNLSLEKSIEKYFFVPWKKRKDTKTNRLPIAKQRENFDGEVIMKGIKNKLMQSNPNPREISITKIAMFLSTSTFSTIFCSSLSLHVFGFCCKSF